jgi:hypothetical protein
MYIILKGKVKIEKIIDQPISNSIHHDLEPTKEGTDISRKVA